MIAWRFGRPDAIDNWYEIRADIRGPDVEAQHGRLARLIDSVRFDPPVVPLDVSAAGRAAALDLLDAYLDGQAADDPAWACFPRTEGAQVSEIRSEPFGPQPALRLPSAARPCSGRVSSRSGRPRCRSNGVSGRASLADAGWQRSTAASMPTEAGASIPNPIHSPAPGNEDVSRPTASDTQ